MLTPLTTGARIPASRPPQRWTRFSPGQMVPVAHSADATQQLHPPSPGGTRLGCAQVWRRGQRAKSGGDAQRPALPDRGDVGRDHPRPAWSHADALAKRARPGGGQRRLGAGLPTRGALENRCGLGHPRFHQCGLAATASAIAATGGVQSPTRFYLFFAVVLAGAFYRPGAALAYLLACGAVHALPLLYDPQAVGAGFLRELLVVVPAYLVLGGALVWGKRMLVSLRVQAETSEAEHRRLAAEQGALSRVATAVAAGEGPQEVYRLISEEAARLMGASASGLLRVQSAREMVVVGSWSLLATASMSLPSAFRAGRGPGLAAGRAERMAPRSHSAAAGGGADPRRGQDRCPRCRASEDRTAHRR